MVNLVWVHLFSSFSLNDICFYTFFRNLPPSSVFSVQYFIIDTKRVGHVNYDDRSLIIHIYPLTKIKRLLLSDSSFLFDSTILSPREGAWPLCLGLDEVLPVWCILLSIMAVGQDNISVTLSIVKVWERQTPAGMLSVQARITSLPQTPQQKLNRNHLQHLSSCQTKQCCTLDVMYQLYRC